MFFCQLNCRYLGKSDFAFFLPWDHRAKHMFFDTIESEQTDQDGAGHCTVCCLKTENPMPLIKVILRADRWGNATESNPDIGAKTLRYKSIGPTVLQHLLNGTEKNAFENILNILPSNVHLVKIIQKS